MERSEVKVLQRAANILYKHQHNLLAGKLRRLAADEHAPRETIVGHIQHTFYDECRICHGCRRCGNCACGGVS